MKQTHGDNAGPSADTPWSAADQAESTQTDSAEPRKRPGKKPLIILAMIVILLLATALVFWLINRGTETTDDAFTDGNAVIIAPKTSGYIVRLLVRDNQKVSKGQLLAEIDPRDATAQLDQARAQLGLAMAQLQQAEAQLTLSRVRYPAQREQALAARARAGAELQNAEAAYRRQHGVDPKATTQTNIDSATARWRSAQAEYQNASAQVAIASQVALQIRQQETNVEARQQQVSEAQAGLETATLNLSYTRLLAPFSGYVTRRNIQQGSLVQAGTALFSLVSPDIWITANFKESQLQYMKPGDAVNISIDAWPDLKLQGHVDSIQMGTGSRFSAFPAENATGNFVKIVQRVPVKIVIDKGLDPDRPLPLGLSAEPEVRVQ
ncbi:MULTISPECIES: HlyD family secretion protein [Tatumella]|uniref:HlyD family secretion protein n=1 Tax=Tatumella punctata TaxID=399969 RepID=A0ABW1VRJ5_9GAMM|nr:HlyD family secretion protein [Tatumella sp. JGM130]MBS0894304.1 HlyD family secretion protein [Tatumella sp. JGM130]